jgi:isoleucyl-tRNA synthetase
VTAADSAELAAAAGEGWALAEGNGFRVALDPRLTPTLLAEGRARDLVRHVQNLRKELDLQVDDRIALSYAGSDAVAALIAAHGDYIAGETLAVAIRRLDAPPAGSRTLKLGGETIAVAIAVHPPA